MTGPADPAPTAAERRAARTDPALLARIGADTARILVVDDIAENRDLLRRRIERLGVPDVSLATDGIEALAMIRAERFDLVFLDVMMPQMNGYEVLEALRAEGLIADVPVVVISALTEMDSVVRCIELGAEDYLAKPFNATLLRARLYALLEKKRLRDQMRASLRRMEHELEAARAMQLSMLPAPLAGGDGWPVVTEVHLEPARQVGGDLIDVFPLGPDHCGAVLGDVSGKGPAAALYMARAYGVFRSLAQSWQGWVAGEAGAAAFLEQANRQLVAANDACNFLTLLFVVLDVRTGALVYGNAGHLPPFRLRAGTAPEALPGRAGLPLGIDGDAVYRTASAILAPGDVLVVYSDGVTEAMDTESVLFGDDRLLDVLGTLASPEPEATVAAVRQAVGGHIGAAEPSDDVAILALAWTG